MYMRQPRHFQDKTTSTFPEFVMDMKNHMKIYRLAWNSTCKIICVGSPRSVATYECLSYVTGVPAVSLALCLVESSVQLGGYIELGMLCRFRAGPLCALASNRYTHKSNKRIEQWASKVRDLWGNNKRSGWRVREWRRQEREKERERQIERAREQAPPRGP